ncbi:MAG: SGNH/GDSL hydrolase family protein [Candidatus Saccharimonadales bacterium]
MRILIFGDSVGQGFYDEIDGGWVRMLQRDYFADDIAGKSYINVINLSVSGHSSNEVLERLDNESTARQNDDKMTIILAIGVNDSYEKNGQRRTEESDFTNNVTTIIERAKSYGDVLVLGCSACVDSRVQPTGWNPVLHYSNELLQKYEALLQVCAYKAAVPFVPLWTITNKAQQEQETLPDGIHPNNAEHKVIYETVKENLRQFA